MLSSLVYFLFQLSFAVKILSFTDLNSI